MLNSRETVDLFSKATKIETENVCEYHIIGTPLTYSLNKRSGLMQTFLSNKVVDEMIIDFPNEMFFDVVCGLFAEFVKRDRGLN